MNYKEILLLLAIIILIERCVNKHLVLVGLIHYMSKKGMVAPDNEELHECIVDYYRWKAEKFLKK